MAAENKNTAKNTVQTFDISKSSDTLDLATDLAKFIKENRLYQNIQGKEYVNVEAWQYAGSRLGIVPVVQAITDISTSDEIKYMAQVSLIELGSFNCVGSGFAICSNREQGKKYYQEFAISSMAQTRAIGKAYRNLLAWVIRAAGYEPEMPDEIEAPTEATPQKEKAVTTKVTARKENPEKEQVPAGPKEPGKALSTEQKPDDDTPITTKQLKEIRELLENPFITKQEKTKMLTGISTIGTKRADASIAKIKEVIKDREFQQANPNDASPKQIEFISKLMKSHHINTAMFEAVQNLLDLGMDKTKAEQVIDELSRKIKAGEIYERDTEATEEQLEILAMLSEHEDIPEKERDKAKSKATGPLSIAQANREIERLQGFLDNKKNK